MNGLYPAKVINNNDTSKKGRIQIKIEHLHWGISNSDLPWAKQCSLSTGGSNLSGSSFIPENNTFVWVWFEDRDEFLRNPFYLADIHFSNFHPHNLFENNVASSLGSASIYPNTKYTYYPNGICIGVDSSSSNPEIFIYHPSAYFFIDNAGVVTIKSGTTAVQKMSLGENLSALLGAILDGIAAITVLDTGTPTVPAGTWPIANAATFTTLKSTYIGASAPTPIISTNIKNN
jgi:hypothetical protein